MVESLGSNVLPYLQPALQVLMHVQADVADVTDVLSLAHQLIARFKESLLPLAEQLVPALATRVHGLLGAGWDWTGRRPAGGATPQEQAVAASQVGLGHRVYNAFLRVQLAVRLAQHCTLAVCHQQTSQSVEPQRVVPYNPHVEHQHVSFLQLYIMNI